MIQPQYAQPYAQGTPSANAVNIQIFEPKAYASPQGAMATPPMQPNYTNQLYNYPQASLYGAPQQQYMPYPMQQMPVMYQPVPQYPGYITQQPQPYAIPQYPQYPGYQEQMAQVPIGIPQVVSPEPQPMPEPVIQQVQPQPAPVEQQPQEVQPQPQAQEVQPQPQAQPQEVQPKPQPVEVQPAQQPAAGIDVASLVSGLQNTDPSVQEKTITEIANYSQGEPAQAQQVLNEQIMTSLANIVNSDITQLQGPTPEQNAIFEKAAKGEQLTPEETQLAQQLSPQTAAAKNKIISMFTLAMLQKNQRDELDAYMASQGANNIKPLQMQDLIGFNEIQNAVQNDSNPEIRLAGIQALSYVARPEDAQTVQNVLQNSLNDPEPLIQQAAQETLSKLGAAPSQPQAQAQEAQQAQAPQEQQAPMQQAA